jgi:hypothetical protein
VTTKNVSTSKFEIRALQQPVSAGCWLTILPPFATCRCIFFIHTLVYARCGAVLESIID